MTRKARIVIEMGGGLIHQVMSNGVEVEIAVVDYNADDVNPKELIPCPPLQGDPEPIDAYASLITPEVNAERVDLVFDAIKEGFAAQVPRKAEG